MATRAARLPPTAAAVVDPVLALLAATVGATVGPCVGGGGAVVTTTAQRLPVKPMGQSQYT